MCNAKIANTLFVSDLDGTLLNANQRISNFSRETLNRLIDVGLHFTYATARSLTSAKEVTEGLNLKMPVIVYNGAFVQDAESGRTVTSKQFLAGEASDILALFFLHDVYPRVYALHDGVERFAYLADYASVGTVAYLAKRSHDKRANPTSEDKLLCGDVFCFSVIDEYNKLLPLYEALRYRYHAILYRDPYTNDYWLEILPKYATKADAVTELKKMYDFDRVVVFGDEKNDLSMFEIADDCFAVANANDEVKRVASGVIASHDCDGVAKYLLSLV